MQTALIDGDILVYRIGFASQPHPSRCLQMEKEWHSSFETLSTERTEA